MMEAPRADTTAGSLPGGVDGPIRNAFHHNADKRKTEGGHDHSDREAAPQPEVGRHETRSKDEHRVPEIGAQGEKIPVGEVDQLENTVDH